MGHFSKHLGRLSNPLESFKTCLLFLAIFVCIVNAQQKQVIYEPQHSIPFKEVIIPKPGPIQNYQLTTLPKTTNNSTQTIKDTANKSDNRQKDSKMQKQDQKQSKQVSFSAHSSLQKLLSIPKTIIYTPSIEDYSIVTTHLYPIQRFIQKPKSIPILQQPVYNNHEPQAPKVQISPQIPSEPKINQIQQVGPSLQQPPLQTQIRLQNHQPEKAAKQNIQTKTFLPQMPSPIQIQLPKQIQPFQPAQHQPQIFNFNKSSESNKQLQVKKNQYQEVPEHKLKPAKKDRNKYHQQKQNSLQKRIELQQIVAKQNKKLQQQSVQQDQAQNDLGKRIQNSFDRKQQNQRHKEKNDNIATYVQKPLRKRPQQNIIGPSTYNQLTQHTPSINRTVVNHTSSIQIPTNTPSSIFIAEDVTAEVVLNGKQALEQWSNHRKATEAKKQKQLMFKVIYFLIIGSVCVVGVYLLTNKPKDQSRTQSSRLPSEDLQD